MTEPALEWKYQFAGNNFISLVRRSKPHGGAARPPGYLPCEAKSLDSLHWFAVYLPIENVPASLGGVGPEQKS